MLVVIDNTGGIPVSHVSVIDNSGRREQVREAMARFRKRRRRGFYWRSIIVTKAQLDELELRGYLDPDHRGNRLDESEAIETFLIDALTKTR